MASLSLKYVALLCAGSFASWLILNVLRLQVLSLVRRFLLVIFSLSLIPLYTEITSKIKTYICLSPSISSSLRHYLANYKGTDWVDGFITATFVFIYLGIIGVLWMRELRPRQQQTPLPFDPTLRWGNNRRN